jgi:tripartite-type tricarboxylate transporter receptor subunit TctC
LASRRHRPHPRNRSHQPVTAVVPASAGGPTDTIARVVMARPALLGQTIVVENRRGIRTIGTGRVVRADRRLIGIGSVNHYVVNASVYPLATTR